MALLPALAPRRPPAPWASADQDGPTTGSSRARVTPPRIGPDFSATQPARGRGAWLGLAALYATWRFRRQLLPPAVITVMAVIAGIGHAAAEGLAWLPLLVAALVGGWLALQAHKPIHRWYVGGVAAAGLWMAAAWWVGLWDPVVMTGLLGLAGAGPVVWWAHHMPRSRVDVAGGSRWPWEWSAYRFRQRHRRRLREVVEWWPLTAQQAKVPRAKVRRAIADVDSPEYVLVVDLKGHALVDLAKGRNWLESGLRARRATLRVDQDPEWAHLARVIWRRDDAPVEQADPGLRVVEEEAS